jgi:hypothetical protein
MDFALCKGHILYEELLFILKFQTENGKQFKTKYLHLFACIWMSVLDTNQDKLSSFFFWSAFCLNSVAKTGKPDSCAWFSAVSWPLCHHLLHYIKTYSHITLNANSCIVKHRMSFELFFGQNSRLAGTSNLDRWHALNKTALINISYQ